MEAPNANAYTPTPIKSWYGYMDLVERNDAITKEIQEKYGEECPPGSLSWPSDLQLLEAYGVTHEDIFKKLTEIINATGLQIKDEVERARSSSDKTKTLYSFSCEIEGKFKVEAFYEFNDSKVKKVTCAYCKQILARNIGYLITNLSTAEKIDIPVVMLHLLEKHKDLGDPPGILSIDPTKICRILELGNTDIDEDNFLYDIAQAGKKPFAELESYNYDKYKKSSAFKFRGVCTLMLSSQSGRG